MDDLIASFGSTNVTLHHNTPHAEHPRFALYKAKSSGSSQTERRKRVLEARKGARYDLLSYLRSIEDGDQYDDDNEDEMDYDEEKVLYKRPKRYKDFLMLSEWLVDVPEDFASTYYTVPCPVGKRSLVVSAQGKTQTYTKSGYRVNQFPSLLPGGSRRNSHTGYALLDCIYSECDKTFYVIDIMCWVNQAVIGCDTVFRFEWLKCRLEEDCPGIDVISKYNPFRFVRVPFSDSSSESLTNMFDGRQLPFPVPLDGILFYNQNTHYTHGPSPLVGWLKGYMLPEILGINVAEKYLAERPARYTNLPSHIEYGKQLNERRKNKVNEMEISEQNDKPKIIESKKRLSDEMESGET